VGTLNVMITKKRHRDGTTKVVFSLPDAGQPVSVVGDFNGWDPLAHPMRRRANGKRSVSLMLPPGCSFRFRYLTADGHFFDDAEGDGFEPNGYGDTHTLLAI
jgi:1,4-alpha-glucan branching enzyme